MRIFFVDFYSIPSGSMEPNIWVGDRIFVNKLCCGGRIQNLFMIYKKKVEFIRLKTFGKIKRLDILVFNLPEIESELFSHNNPYGEIFIKRCVAISGDTFSIENGQIKNKYFFIPKTNHLSMNDSMLLLKKRRKEKINSLYHQNTFFPHDTNFNWDLDNFGPIIVPAKSRSLKINFHNISLYNAIIQYENNKVELRDTLIYINGLKTFYYTFKNNYYFMLGDNFYNSHDSRYWGFVPETHIIGKAVFVLFSIDPNEPWYKAIRWGRFLNSVK